jgi:transposase
MSQLLEAFAEQVGVSAHRRVVLLVDNAGWHRSPKLVIPEGLHLAYLPPYSPELQPAERVWTLVRSATANQDLRTIEALNETIDRRCQELDQQTELVQGATCFHWLPTDRPAKKGDL